MKAAEWLAEQPGVDPTRIALLGWSHGGQTVLSAALKNDTFRRKVRFSAMIAFYPGCSQFIGEGPGRTDHGVLSHWDEEPGVQILIGEKDDWTRRQDCVTLIQRLNADDPEQTRVTLLEPSGLYKGAYHGFDGHGRKRARRLVSEDGRVRLVHSQGGPRKARNEARKNVKAVFISAFYKTRPDEEKYDWRLVEYFLDIYFETDWYGEHDPGRIEDEEIYSEDFLRRERLNEERYDQLEAEAQAQPR